MAGERESQDQEEFNFAVNIVRQAGEIIRQAFEKDKSITEKTCHNDLGKYIQASSYELEHFILYYFIVTDTDRLVETFIVRSIRENYPTSK